MARNPRLRGLEIRRILLLAVGLVPSLGLLGCADVPRVSMRAERSRIEMWMDPASHKLRARTVLDLVASGDQTAHPGGPVAVAWLLHPDLRVTGIQTAGVGRRYGGYRAVESTGDPAPGPPGWAV